MEYHLPMQSVMGKILFDSLSSFEFKPTAEGVVGLDFFCEEYFPLICIEENKDSLETIVAAFESFIYELILKLEISAQVLAKGIYITPNLAERLKNKGGSFVRKIISGHPLYLPFLNRKEDFKIGSKCVMLNLRFGITLASFEYPALFSFSMNTEGWMHVDKTMDTLEKVCLLEKFDVEDI
jgi:hypothetical protein